jgi:hypothetical protein
MVNRKIAYRYGAKTVEYCPRWHNPQHYTVCCESRSCFGGYMAIAVPPSQSGRAPATIDVVVCNWREEDEGTE